MKIKRLNKKGARFLTEETLNLVLGVIAIVILMFLAWALYGLFTKKTDFQQAQASLKRISENIQKVENGDLERAEFFLESPSDWWVIAWPYQGQEDIPESCEFNCVCVCLIPKIPTQKNSLANCDKSGVCIEVPREVKTIYEADPPGWFKKVTRSVINFLGYETKNVPLDIGGPTPLEISIEEEILLIKKV